MKPSLYRKLPLCVGIALASATANAQLSENELFALEEIVVTATRVSETDLQTTPIAVSAFSGSDLENRNVQDLQDVAGFVPSLSIGNRSGKGAGLGAVTLRGMGTDALDSSGSVGIYIDDVYYASNFGNLLGLMDVERLEVLRGPQGTVFGRNTIAGAIQYVTKAPGEELGGYVKASLGDYGREDIAAAIDLPVNDQLSFRLAGMSNSLDGYVRDNLNGVDRGETDDKGVRLRMRWTPTEKLMVDAKAEYAESSNNGRTALITQYNNNGQFIALANAFNDLFGIPAPPFGYTDADIAPSLDPDDFSYSGSDAAEGFDSDTTIFQVTFSYDVSDNLTLRSITSQAETSARIDADFDLTPQPLLAVTDYEDVDAFSQEFQLIGSAMDSQLHYTLGAFYFDTNRRHSQPLKIGNLPFDESNGEEVYDIVSTALYGQVAYDLTDKVTLAVGLRYTNDDVDAAVEGAFNSVTLQPETFDGVSETFTDTSPYVGLNFSATEDIFLFAKVSKGFRAGGFTLNKAFITDPAVLALGASFEPETAWTYEAGARIEGMDGRLRFNATVFQTDWEDLQFLQPVEVPNVITSNAGDAEIMGLEIETQFAATSKLVLSGSFSYLDAEYTRLDPNIRVTFPDGFVTNPGNIPGVPSFFAGGPPMLPVGAPTIRNYIELDTPMARAPEFKYTIGARFTQPLDSGAELVVTGDYAWIDKQKGIAEAIADEMPSYGLLNGRIQYSSADEVWGVALFGSNLTNEYYELSSTSYDTGLTVGPRVIDVGRPRTVGVELSLNF